jgi:hypothetical protein
VFTSRHQLPHRRHHARVLHAWQFSAVGEAAVAYRRRTSSWTARSCGGCCAYSLEPSPALTPTVHRSRTLHASRLWSESQRDREEGPRRELEIHSDTITREWSTSIWQHCKLFNGARQRPQPMYNANLYSALRWQLYPDRNENHFEQ